MEFSIARVIIVLLCGHFVSALPLSSKNSRGFIVTPDNIRTVAVHLYSHAYVGPRSIRFEEVASGYELFDIPLAGYNELKPDTTIRITIGMKPPPANESSSPAIGLKGYDAFHAFFIFDPSFYDVKSPCFPADRPPEYVEHENNLVPPDTPHASQYVMVFKPFNSYGTCSSPQNGGFVNVATFDHYIDLKSGLHFCGKSGLNDYETYEFYYFIIDIIN